MFAVRGAASDWLGIGCDCLLAHSLGRVMVGNQPPVPLLLTHTLCKASVTGNSLAFVLPIPLLSGRSPQPLFHRRAPLTSSVVID